MADETDDQGPSLIELASLVVANYVTNNAVTKDELPALIHTVHGALSGTHVPPAPVAERKPPAVPIKKSITPDYLISLEDGKPYRLLKRHLTGLGMTGADYRAKWGLPSDYPMVAPNYAATRSKLALAAGLGKRGAGAAAIPAPKVPPSP